MDPSLSPSSQRQAEDSLVIMYLLSLPFARPTTHHLRACPIRAIILLGGTMDTSWESEWAMAARRFSLDPPA